MRVMPLCASALRAVAAPLLCAALLLGLGTANAQTLQPVPALTARVIDRSGTLTPEQITALESQLAAFEAEAGPQIVVLIVKTTAPEDIAAYAYRVADTWKIGRKEVGDGVLMLVAKDDRRMRIEVARALEGAVPDLAARQIIDRAIGPKFKAGDYAGGLHDGIEQLKARINGEHLPLPERTRDARKRGANVGLQWDELAMFLFIGVPVVGGLLVGMLGRKLGSLATGAAAGGIAWSISASLLLAGVAGVVSLLLVGLLGIGSSRGRRGSFGGLGGTPVIWGGGGGRGWGGGGGGGFSSGGGGSFGGGGASGSW